MDTGPLFTKPDQLYLAGNRLRRLRVKLMVRALGENRFSGQENESGNGL
jgi:hypothetical protein